MNNCNCEPKNISIGMGCCEPVLAPIQNYYTKWEVDRKIESAVTSGCCITPEEVDEKIEEAISGITVSGVTEEQMNEAISAATDGLASEGYVNAQISSQTADFVTGEELSSYTYDKATIDSKIVSGGTFDPTQYYNKTATDELLAEKLDASAYTPTDLSNYYTKSETSGATQIQTALNVKADSSTLNNYLLKSKLWCGTQNEYDSITTKDPETLYLIHS